MEERVVLIRLNANDGFYSISDCLPIVGELQNKGISAICEQSPGALMDSQDSYLIKVPVNEHNQAQEVLNEYLKK